MVKFTGISAALKDRRIEGDEKADHDDKNSKDLLPCVFPLQQHQRKEHRHWNRYYSLIE